MTCGVVQLQKKQYCLSIYVVFNIKVLVCPEIMLIIFRVVYENLDDNEYVFFIPIEDAPKARIY